MSKRIDHTGHVFGKLKVLRYHGLIYRGLAAWECECECGKLTIVSGASLRAGYTQSCGCYQKDYARKAHSTHGLSKEFKRAYDVWYQMLRRCKDVNNPGYKNYGGRGISVCESWSAFENFLADMGSPSKGMSLERKDNNKGYSKENCKWATGFEQHRNQRTNVWLEFRNEKKILSDWAREYRLDRSLVKDRINRGWSVEKALTTPPRPMKLKEKIENLKKLKK